MKALEILAASIVLEKPSFLLIGGHAVNLYGYSRTTHDLDLLVSRSGSEQMKSLLLAGGYSIFREEGAFIQMTPAANADWPVDLMVVTDETFSKLAATSREKKMGSITVRVPCVEHLIALKLHVLKQELPHRTIKDFCDVQELVERNAVDLKSSEMQGIFERYGMKTSTTESKLPAATNSSLGRCGVRLDEANDFELPDQPSFDSRPPRLSFEHAFALSEQSLAWARENPGFEEERLRTKCRAEFIM